MKTIKRLYGKRFSLESQAKSYIFGHFFRDSSDWAALFHHSRKFPIHNMSIMTKQFIMLRMAIAEYVLKSILIGLSKKNETAKDIYKIALNCRHNIEKLIEECKRRSNGRYRICNKAAFERIKKIEKLGIGIRYDLNMKMAYKNQSFAEWATGTGPVSGVVIDEDFHKLMHKDLLFFVALAKRVCNKRLKGHNITSGDRIGDVHDYIKKIIA